MTVCTRNQICSLGNIRDGVVHLSPIGQIVAEEWQRTAHVRQGVELDQWVVMPNHLHGIVVMTNLPAQGDSEDTSPAAPRPGRGLQPRSLSSIVGQFKSVCTKRARALGFAEFGWQTRFYDHIIRSEASLGKIRQYIIDNPVKWDPERGRIANLSM